MVMAALILRYEWDSHVEWDIVAFPLCPAYGSADAAHALIERRLFASDFIEIRDAGGSLWPINRETLQVLIVWTVQRF